jgi:hypothetical protein
MPSMRQGIERWCGSRREQTPERRRTPPQVRGFVPLPRPRESAASQPYPRPPRFNPWPLCTPYTLGRARSGYSGPQVADGTRHGQRRVPQHQRPVRSAGVDEASRMCRQAGRALLPPSRGQCHRGEGAGAVCRVPRAGGCLEYANETVDTMGVWGGMTQLERRAVRVNLATGRGVA